MNAAPSATEIRHVIGAAGNLSIRNVAGRVRLTATDGEEVVVRSTGGRAGEPELNIERTEGGLLVEPRRDGKRLFGLVPDLNDTIDFDVVVPRGARLDIKTVSADIDASGLVGDQGYKTVSADVRLRDVGGRVSVMSVSGDVRLQDGRELALDGATTSGDFTVEASLLHVLGLRTISGDIHLRGRLAQGPRHSVETVSGDLHLESTAGITLSTSSALDLGRRDRGPTVVGDGSARLAFRTMSGDHAVSFVPEDPHASASQPPTAEPWDYAPPPPPATDARLEVLRALERGEIDVEEASRQLESMAGG